MSKNTKKIKQVTVKKLFLGHVSIRDYIVNQCLNKGMGIVVKFDKRKMTISYDQLKNKKQITKQLFSSKYGTKDYQLYDFPFVPDELNKTYD